MAKILARESLSNENFHGSPVENRLKWYFISTKVKCVCVCVPSGGEGHVLTPSQLLLLLVCSTHTLNLSLEYYSHFLPKATGAHMLNEVITTMPPS